MDAVKKLVAYAMERGLIEESDRVWAINAVLGALQLDAPAEVEAAEHEAVELAAADDSDALAGILEPLLDDAFRRGVIPRNSTVYRDLLDTEIMGRLTPRPAQIRDRFRKEYESSPEQATCWYYRFSQDTNYIRRDRVKRDLRWTVDTSYGEMDLSINLSKPEKDPADIAAAGQMAATDYPACQLCIENEGYAGRLDHPARQNLRMIPLTICGEEWFLQYSPYTYYNEHCIVLNRIHRPMRIDRDCFAKLLSFVEQFPHYFVGSNADLPIVGGSILSHEHFQGGRYTFAMERAPLEREFTCPGFPGVAAGTVRWPMSVIRLTGLEPEELIQLAEIVRSTWSGYSDEDRMIIAQTNGTRHNTVTPIARRRREAYELDLVLRNNRTTEEHPLGIFHPHQQLHHIKKENIGLIEVMGLAVLPARLQREMQQIAQTLRDGGIVREQEGIEKHADWIEELRKEYDFQDSALDIPHILQEEIGKVFVRVLEDAGVFKRDADGQQGFDQFIQEVGKRCKARI